MSFLLKFSLNVYNIGSVAQLVEQWIEAPCVGGSIPSRAMFYKKAFLAGVV